MSKIVLSTVVALAVIIFTIPASAETPATTTTARFIYEDYLVLDSATGTSTGTAVTTSSPDNEKVDAESLKQEAEDVQLSVFADTVIYTIGLTVIVIATLLLTLYVLSYSSFLDGIISHLPAGLNNILEERKPSRIIILVISLISFGVCCLLGVTKYAIYWLIQQIILFFSGGL